MSKCPFKSGLINADCDIDCGAYKHHECVLVRAAETFTKYLEEKMTPVESVFPKSAPAPEVR